MSGEKIPVGAADKAKLFDAYGRELRLRPHLYFEAFVSEVIARGLASPRAESLEPRHRGEFSRPTS